LNVMKSKPSEAAIVGLANSSLAIGKAIINLPTRNELRTKAIVVQR